MSYLKVIATIIVFFEISFFGYLPYIWPDVGRNKRVMGIVGSFAGGLFLALSLLHILPEANQELQKAFKPKGTQSTQLNHLHSAEQKHQIQWGSLIAMLTFVFVLAIEVFVHKYLQKNDASEKKRYQELDYQQAHHHSDQFHSHNHNAHIGSPASSVILTQLALSIHAFIECLALGSQTTKKATMTLLVGIGCHKWAEGLTLGFQYRRANFSAAQALNYCMIHACLNAGAVILGWFTSQSSQLVSGILGAISAGTFLYVSTVQKIQTEFQDKERLGQKILSMLVGIGFVCLIV